MIKTEDMRFFVLLAGQPSLAAAARQLNVTPSAVTQKLQAIEGALSLRLTHRSSRGIILTDEGRVFVERSREILAEIDDLTAVLGRRRLEVRGHLQVLAPFGFGRAYIGPLCGAFSEKYPEVIVSLELSDRLGRHPSQPWDIAIHIGELRDMALSHRKIARHCRMLVAAPEYLSRADPIEHPNDLGRHKCLVLRENEEDTGLWRFRMATGDVAIRVRPSLSSNDGEVVRGWTLAGLGIALRSEWSVARDVAAGRLVELLPQFRPADADIVALVGPANARAERTTRFLALLTEQLSPRPWQEPKAEGQAPPSQELQPPANRRGSSGLM